MAEDSGEEGLGRIGRRGPHRTSPRPLRTPFIDIGRNHVARLGAVRFQAISSTFGKPSTAGKPQLIIERGCNPLSLGEAVAVWAKPSTIRLFG